MGHSSKGLAAVETVLVGGGGWGGGGGGGGGVECSSAEALSASRRARQGCTAIRLRASATSRRRSSFSPANQHIANEGQNSRAPEELLLEDTKRSSIFCLHILGCGHSYSHTAGKGLGFGV